MFEQSETETILQSKARDISTQICDNEDPKANGRSPNLLNKK